MTRRHHSHLNIFYFLVIEMLSYFFSIPRAFFSAIERVLASAMGCILSFYGSKHDSDTSRAEEVRLNHDQSPLYLPFLTEENKSTPIEEKRVEKLELNFEELKNEAQFLKACGTILEIPAEIQEVIGEQNKFSSQKSAVGSPKFKSWLTSNSVEKLDLESPPDHSPTHATNCEKWMEDVGLPRTPSSESYSPNSTEVNTITKLLSSPSQSPMNPSHSTDVIAPSTMKKSIRFSCDPTPLKLVDEMETPGTIFPAYMDTISQGKHPRIRFQFVHPVVHPTESFLPCNPIKNVTRKPLVEIDGHGNSESGSSPWLRGRLTSNQDDMTACQDEISEVWSTPILGVVSAMYGGDETLSNIPKWRDWNGIPNTTNKYKEDQKVSWHATPFEERLEKALSEDAFISQRSQSNSYQQLIL